MGSRSDPARDLFVVGLRVTIGSLPLPIGLIEGDAEVWRGVGDIHDDALHQRYAEAL